MGRLTAIALVLVPACLLASSCGDDNKAELAELESTNAGLRDDLKSATSRVEVLEGEVDARVTEVDDLKADYDDAVKGRDETSAEYKTVVEERDAVVEERDAVADDYEDAISELDTVNEQRDTTIGARDTAIAERETAEEQRDAAIQEAKDLRLAFDPQIESKLAKVQELAIGWACQSGDDAGFEDRDPEPDVARIIDDVIKESLPKAIPAKEARRRVDQRLVADKYRECWQTGATRRSTETLVQVKGDGNWTVGLEIAAGLWRSTGTGTDCYWQISPDGQPDDILSNHFGNAGGSVTLSGGQEFQTSDCGNWEFAG